MSVTLTLSVSGSAHADDLVTMCQPFTKKYVRCAYKHQNAGSHEIPLAEEASSLA